MISGLIVIFHVGQSLFEYCFFFQSDGIARSYTLASQYAKEAVRQINKLSPSPHRDALVKITQEVLKRRK